MCLLRRYRMWNLEHLYVCLNFFMPPWRHLCLRAGNLSDILSASTQHDFFCSLFSPSSTASYQCTRGVMHTTRQNHVTLCAVGLALTVARCLNAGTGSNPGQEHIFFILVGGGGGGHLNACSLSITRSMQFLFCGSQICVFIDLL